MISYDRKMELMDALRNGSEPGLEVQGETAPDNNVPAVDDRQEAQPDLSEQGQETVSSFNEDNSSEEEGHRVPYKRFKSVVDARNDYQREVEKLQEQLADYERRLTSTRKSDAKEESDWDWLESYEEQDSSDYQEDSAYAELSSRMERFELAQAEAVLEKEISQILNAYPGVPEQVLLQAVINDPDVKLQRVAEAYSSFIASTEESAIARYVKENAPTPAPRVKNTTGSAPAQGLVPTETKKIGSVSEGSKALRQLLQGRKGPIF